MRAYNARRASPDFSDRLNSPTRVDGSCHGCMVRHVYAGRTGGARLKWLARPDAGSIWPLAA